MWVQKLTVQQEKVFITVTTLKERNPEAFFVLTILRVFTCEKTKTRLEEFALHSFKNLSVLNFLVLEGRGQCSFGTEETNFILCSGSCSAGHGQSPGFLEGIL